MARTPAPTTDSIPQEQSEEIHAGGKDLAAAREHDRAGIALRQSGAFVGNRRKQLRVQRVGLAVRETDDRDAVPDFFLDR